MQRKVNSVSKGKIDVMRPLFILILWQSLITPTPENNILLIFFADKCLFHNININVDSARTISPITSVQQCQYECQSDKKCLFFTYHMTADVCYLKQGFGTTVYGLEPYYISGPKYCGFTTGIYL